MKRLTYSVIFLSVALGLAGCASINALVSDPDAQALFNLAIERLEAKLADKKTETPTTPTTPESPATPTTPSTAVDEVAYSSLTWPYGGFNGSKSPLDATVRISDLSFSKGSLYYKWASGGCEQLGASSPSDAGATVCAVFFKNSAGIWVGGKFDWISTSRTSRELKHCTGVPGYNGWTMSGIPNPTESCFVIVSVKTGTRSNVIKGRWQR